LGVTCFILAEDIKNCVIVNLEEFHNFRLSQNILSETELDRTCSTYGINEKPEEKDQLRDLSIDWRVIVIVLKKIG
jgi:hypothetical protein